MKKFSKGFWKDSLFFLLLLSNSFICIAQSNSINISITGIEYDDPGFLLLKESLQKNKNVTSIKPSYEQGVAKLNFNYNRNAQNLWDELPPTTRQFFRIATINDNSIVLENKNSVRENSGTNNNNGSNTKKNDNDCKNCYWNMCRYDLIKSIGGKLYKGVITETGTFYYNCDNGIVLSTSLNINGYGSTVIGRTDTLLISNGPVGITWGVSQVSSEILGFKHSNFVRNTLVRKGTTVTLNDKTYNDVLVVNYYRKSYNSLIGGDEAVSINRYYAKGVGLIKEDNLYPNSDALSSVHDSNKPVSIANIPEMKGVVDPGLVGIWTDNDPSGLGFTYKFYADGTYEYYVGSTLSYVGSKCFWRLDGRYLNLYCTGWGKVYKQEFQKKNDNTSGKPAIVIQFKDTEYRTYFSADNKALWK